MRRAPGAAGADDRPGGRCAFHRLRARGRGDRGWGAALRRRGSGVPAALDPGDRRAGAGRGGARELQRRLRNPVAGRRPGDRAAAGAGSARYDQAGGGRAGRSTRSGSWRCRGSCSAPPTSTRRRSRSGASTCGPRCWCWGRAGAGGGQIGNVVGPALGRGGAEGLSGGAVPGAAAGRAEPAPRRDRRGGSDRARGRDRARVRRRVRLGDRVPHRPRPADRGGGRDTARDRGDQRRRLRGGVWLWQLQLRRRRRRAGSRALDRPAGQRLRRWCCGPAGGAGSRT